MTSQQKPTDNVGCDLLVTSMKFITAPELIKTLRNMNLTRFDKKKGFYTGAFTRTNITEAIHAFAGFRLDCALLTESDLKDMIKLTKKP